VLKVLSQALDRCVIRIASSFRADGRPEACDASAAENLLQDPSFFASGSHATPELVFTSPREFEFISPMPGRWVDNNRVHGKLFRAGPDWQRRPSVILMHGWNAELQYRWQFQFLGARLARAGVNAVTFQLPYHGQRRPREPGAIQNFISYDLLHMLEATRQSLADARALLRWLVSQGSPRVGLWGISLGAWLAGLLACAEAQVDFAVLLTPIASVEQAIEELAFCQAIRHSLRNTAVRLDPLNLASHRPLVRPENILIVEAQHDLFAPAPTVENLWRAWGETTIWRLPHGHISILLSPLILKRIVRWIRQKAIPATTAEWSYSSSNSSLL